MELKEYKCNNCGGSVSFNVDKEKLVCNYCKTEYEVGELDQKIEDEFAEESGRFRDHDKDFSPIEKDLLKVYTCNSCGGEIIGDESMAATTCPYCNNNVVIPSKLSGELKPDFVIPFKYDREFAKAQLKEFYKNKRLLPDVFKDENQIENMKGLYVPFWLYSGRAYVDIWFKTTRIRVWSDGRYNYTETSYYDVRRDGDMDFKYVPVDGSSKIDDILMESLEPFHWEEGVEFSASYLAGFLADRYDVDSDTSVPKAKARIKNSSINTIRNQVSNYQTVTIENESFELKDGIINYALAPVWILNTKWQDKYYTFVMNGQTGKMIGDDLPIDRNKAIRKFLIAMIIVFVISMGLMVIIYPNL